MQRYDIEETLMEKREEGEFVKFDAHQAALDAVLKEAIWAMDELDVYLSHDHEASFADRLHAQAFLDSQIVRDYRARQEQG